MTRRRFLIVSIKSVWVEGGWSETCFESSSAAGMLEYFRFVGDPADASIASSPVVEDALSRTARPYDEKDFKSEANMTL